MIAIDGPPQAEDSRLYQIAERRKACYSGLLLLLGREPLLALLASGLLKCPAGIQLSSYALAPEVTAGPSAPTTET